jgi:uroporphyrinogen-III decarboxylase
MIDMGVDMIWLGDDVGMQTGMMMSPYTWREYLKPRMKKLISTFKEYKPGIKVAYHSCGNILPIIPDLIEIGLDVLNPIQPMAMDPAEIKREFGDKLCFWGSMCIQDTLPNGSSKDIRTEVKLRMETIGKGGGLILGPAHNVQADTSVENILAFYEAVKDLGKYY